MAEKRENYRHLKRLQVKFGVGAATTTGFTEDLSDDGLFVKAGMVQGGGRDVVVELTLVEGTIVKFIAKVQWAKKVPPALLRSYKGGMGLKIQRFIDGEKEYRLFCDELWRLRQERNRMATRTLDEGGA